MKYTLLLPLLVLCAPVSAEADGGRPPASLVSAIPPHVPVKAVGQPLVENDIKRAANADVGYGAYLSSECITCHRSDGKDDGIPGISGWPEADFIAVLQSYRDKERDNDAMQLIAGRLSNEEMAALAAYFAQLAD